jgi:serine phosphatase RsbU (regulator of sigma subunit)
MASGRGGDGPQDRQGWFLRVLPYAFTAVVLAADLSTPKDVTFTSVLPVVPALAALGSRDLARTLLASVVALATMAAMFVYSGVAVDAMVASVAALVVVAAVSCTAVRVIGRQSQVLAHVRSVAETAQHVVLRDVPAALGQVQCAVTYSAAAAEARIGGDLYEAMATPFGDRLIIGDVRGKGLPAVEAAADVLGVFREAAYTEPDLVMVATRLHGLTHRTLPEEDFVTAVLLSVTPDEPTVEIVNCGHPPPLRLRGGQVTTLAEEEPGPPLGLFELGEGGELRRERAAFVPGDSILLYTDGTTEARNKEGVFYPLPEFLAGASFEGPTGLVDLVMAGLVEHAGTRLDDDVALLAVQRMPFRTEAAAESGRGDGGSRFSVG